MRLITRLAVLLIMAALSSGWAAIANGANPNVVFLMADDLGYGDVQPLNPDSTIATPNFKQLAAQGMTFTDAHSPSAVCTPTRYGVVTGRYCWRSKLKRGVLNGYGEPLINPARETVASFLKKQGYATGVVGKWHLGLGFVPKDSGNEKRKEFDWTKPLTSSPNVNGFEYSYVIPASLDFPPYVYIHNVQLTAQPTIEQPAVKFPAFLRKGERSPDFVMDEAFHHLTGKATDYIREHANKDKPYFLYVPFTAPHKPVLPHPDFRGKSPLGHYADFVQQVDWGVGQIMKAIDESGAGDNTLLIVTSDNGSFMYQQDERGGPDHVEQASVQGYNRANHMSNGPLRGTKADIWEAGHRVPFFARWPKRVKAGSTCDNTITHTDLFATCAELCSAELPKNAAEDSFSWVSLLDGKEPETKRAPVIHHSGGGMFAIRDGEWKLVLGNGSGGRAKPKGKPFEKPYELYRISDDIAETNNLASEHPEIVERLTKSCQMIMDSGRSR